MRIRLLALILSFFALAPSAFSARPFPQDARLGTLSGHQYPLVQIDGKTLRLAPGARVFDQDNRLILPNQLPGEGPVMYQIDITGHLIGLWLLTGEEYAAAKAAKKR